MLMVNVVPAIYKAYFRKELEPEIIFYSKDVANILPHNNDHMVIIV